MGREQLTTPTLGVGGLTLSDRLLRYEDLRAYLRVQSADKIILSLDETSSLLCKIAPNFDPTRKAA
jgi:hypothetical protein